VARVQTIVAKHAALNTRLRGAIQQRLRRAHERLAPLVRTLNAVSPLATLERGYAIVANADGNILRDAADAPPGSVIDARLAKGSIRAKVLPP
jgi:exodeoxyribonuclease VII large subunit